MLAMLVDVNQAGWANTSAALEDSTILPLERWQADLGLSSFPSCPYLADPNTGQHSLRSAPPSGPPSRRESLLVSTLEPLALVQPAISGPWILLLLISNVLLGMWQFVCCHAPLCKQCLLYLESCCRSSAACHNLYLFEGWLL